MGRKTEEKEEFSLMEFLYKDTDILDSLYSQVFGGDLESITKTSGLEEAATLEGGLNIGVAKTGANSTDKVIEGMDKKIVPKDSKVIELFSELDLKLYNKSLNNLPNGKLVKLEASISFKNLNSLKNILPLISELNFIPFGELGLGEMNETSKKLFIDFISNSLPGGLDFELKTSRFETVTCSIKDSHLSKNINEISKNYTSKYLGKWIVIGIFDNIKPITYQSPNTEQNITESIEDLENSLSSTFYPKDNNYFILKPIVIYRILSY